VSFTPRLGRGVFGSATHVYFQNASPWNLFVAMAMRMRRRAVVQYIHEVAVVPGQAWAPSMRTRGALAIQGALALLGATNVVSSPSVQARLGRVLSRRTAVVDLIYPRIDPSGRPNPTAPASTSPSPTITENNTGAAITYLGRVDERRGFSQFVELAEAEQRRGGSLRFILATNSQLSSELLDRVQQLALCGRMELHVGRVMTDAQVDEVLNASSVVLLLYQYQICQSGVIGVALRNGASVLTTRFAVDEGSYDDAVVHIVEPMVDVEQLRTVIVDMMKTARRHVSAVAEFERMHSPERAIELFRRDSVIDRTSTRTVEVSR
jgi:hypothetical protein